MGRAVERTIATTSLADLDAFAAVARARSLRGAAGLRGVPSSTLSEALRRLEAGLGAAANARVGVIGIFEE